MLAASRNSATGLSFMTPQKHGEPADTADIPFALRAVTEPERCGTTWCVPVPPLQSRSSDAAFLITCCSHMRSGAPMPKPSGIGIGSRVFCLTGHGSEVGRCFYRLPPYARHPLNARRLGVGRRLKSSRLSINGWLRLAIPAGTIYWTCSTGNNGWVSGWRWLPSGV